MAFTVDSLTSLTQNKIVPRLADCAFLGSPLAYWLKDNHSVKLDGGLAVRFPIIKAQLTGDWYDATDTATLATADPFSTASFNWKWLRVPFVLAETDIDKNDGVDGILNLIEATAKTAELTIIDLLSDGLHGTNASNSKQMDGLQNMFAASGTAYGSLTDTDFTGDASWLTQIHTMVNTGLPSTLTAFDMRVMRGKATKGSARPNLALCNFPTYDKIWALAQDDQRFGMEKMAKLGFEHIVFEDMAICPDEHAPGTGFGTADSWLMMLNTDYVSFVIHRNKAFVSRVYAPIPQQELYIGKVLLGCNLTTNNRRMHAVTKVINPSL